MSFGILSLIAFVVAIGVLVSVHEFGHYWVARRLGFKVLRYSLGFGKPLLMRIGRDPDRIEYVLSAIPLGGYVRLLDEREGPVPPGEEHRAFNRRPPLARIAVLLAGPAANFVFAIVACWLLYLIGMPGLKAVVGEVAGGSYAAVAGLATGDEVVRVGEYAPATRQNATLAILERVVEDGRVPLTVRRGGSERELEMIVPDDARRALTEPGSLMQGLGFDFWTPPPRPLVGDMDKGGAAERAGFETGDVIVEVDGAPVADAAAFVDAIRARPGRRTEVIVERQGQRRRIEVTPPAVVEGGRTIGRIGIALRGLIDADDFPRDMRIVERYGALAAILPAARETWDKSAMTLRFLWRMVTGHVSTKNISGPINIAQYAGLTASAGFIYYLNFLALVSISLAVLNLLPVPVLDGGQIAFQVAEMVKGSPLSMQVQVVGQKVGIAMLVALMGFAFYNDISQLFG